MTAREQNFTMMEGALKKIDVDETTDEDAGGTLDISGRNGLTWLLAESPTDETALVEKTESGSNDVTVTDESVGAYEVTIQPSDTNGLARLQFDDEQDYYHEVTLSNGNSKDVPLLKGTITIEASP